ncbi:hypothetical protein BGZ93_002000 [Podila epicladia]|nr:hypothetical protein BGZ92_001767 [Podila epicladia]KAG0083148.1 hypothetical protein BGZ93_002000 [Podila epicladia]
MKSLLAITLIAALAVTSAMAVQEVIPQVINAAVNIDEKAIAAVVAASIPALAEEEKTLWKKKKKKHHKYDKHKRRKCCIKYVTITTTPVCQSEPTKCPVPAIVIDSVQVNVPIAPPAPLPL